MNKIKLLSEDLINKIAAGEVIERPASVVKELIENSIDAQATRITIEIIGAGTKLIKISDNGHGMSEEDAKRSILRHATSKISNEEDLFNINSLGFRGEALASISAVSKLGIKTKERTKIEGYQIDVEGGLVTKSEIVATTEGTIINITDLFYNTPARKKFLKSDLIELRHIIEIVTKYALANPLITFKLINESREIINTPSTPNQRANISYIYGSILAKDLLKIKPQDQEKNIKITGHICKPLSARNDKNQQALFVNNRWVRNSDINQAIYDSYHSLLFTGKHPIYVINITIDPKKIDVNVHPNKTEIKIEQKETLYKEVYDAVHGCLRENNLIPEMDFNVETQLSFGTPEKKEKKKEVKYQFEPSEQTIFVNKKEEPQQDKIDVGYTQENNPTLKIKENSEINGYNQNDNIKDHGKILEELNEQPIISPPITINESEDDNFISGSIKFPAMKILGQVHKTFFIAETPGGMLIIDQHVVQERVLYEKFMTQYLNSNIEIQQLLQKELLTFTNSETLTVIENLDRLKKLGFELSHFGENDFWLCSVPTLLGRTQSKDLIYLIVKEIFEGKIKELERIQEEILTMMSCRASVKAGDVMTIPQIKKLMDELVNCKLPYTCPHGRAIVVKISAEELEKKFLRHG